MLDIESCVKLLRTLVVAVSMCMAIHWFSGCQHFCHHSRETFVSACLFGSQLKNIVARCELVHGFHMGVVHHMLHTGLMRQPETFLGLECKRYELIGIVSWYLIPSNEILKYFYTFVGF